MAKLIKSLAPLEGTKIYGTDMAFHEQQSKLAGVFSCYYEASPPKVWLLMWDLSNINAPKLILEQQVNGTGARIAFSPDGTQLAILGYGTVSLLDINSQKELYKVEPKIYLSAAKMLFTPDSQWLVAAISNYIVTLNAQTGDVVTRFETFKHRMTIIDLSVSPDYQYLASCGVHPYLRLWDFETGKQLKRISCHTGNVNCAAFSPDGRWLASGGGDRNIIIREVNKKWPEIQKLSGHQYSVETLAFSSDNRYLVSGSMNMEKGDGIIIWRTDTWEKVTHITNNVSINLLKLWESKKYILAMHWDPGSISIYDVGEVI